MPIIDLQRRIAEAGRIRIGSQVPTGTEGKTRPVKLETFRLTSPDKLRIEQAAAMWGGDVQEWQAPSGRQWEVFTKASALDVIVPPADMAFSQSYELWSAGGCQRRCDGVSESLSGGECLCDPERRACDIHTRLSVLLRDLPGLGVWRVDTQGYYAAVELQGAVQVIEMAAGRGQLLPARLLLVQRQVKRLVNDKPQTRKFAVPVLDVEVTPGQLLAPSTPGPLALTQEPSNGHDVDGSASLATAPSLTPVPASVQHHPAGSVAEQMRASTVPQERKRRANSAQPVPATGVEPRTAAQAAADLAAGETSAIRPYLLPADAEPVEPPSDDPGTVTSPQIRHLQAVLAGHGFNGQKEPDTLLQIVEILAGRELTGPHKRVGGNLRTTKNLSEAEAGNVIDALEACDSQAAVWLKVGEIDQAATDRAAAASAPPAPPVEEMFPDADPPPF